MRRIFNLFMKEVNPKKWNYSTLTTKFNKWVSSAKTSKGAKRFNFKAYTTKHTVMKWI